MATSAETPVSWTLPFTVADQSTIATLDAETRAAVERYRRHSSVETDEHAIARELKSIREELRELNASRSSAEWRLDEVLRDLQPTPEARVA